MSQIPSPTFATLELVKAMYDNSHPLANNITDLTSGG